MNKTKFKREDLRKNRAHVRLNESESLQIKKMMLETGLTGQQLMKDALFSRTDLEEPVFNPEQTANFLEDLKKVGNELNEIAKGINSGTLTNWSKRLAGVASMYLKLKLRLEGVLPMIPEKA